MTCGGRTYVVNEDDGFCNGTKVKRYRDTSFKSIVSFMLLLLLFWVLLSCVIWAIQNDRRKKSDLTPDPTDGAQEKLHNDNHFTTEPNKVSTTRIPVTEIFKKETAYTVGQNKTTISTESTRKYTGREEKTNQSTSRYIPEQTTSQYRQNISTIPNATEISSTENSKQTSKISENRTENTVGPIYTTEKHYDLDSSKKPFVLLNTTLETSTQLSRATTQSKYTVRVPNSNTSASPQNSTIPSSITESSISENVSSISNTIKNNLETATVESRNSSFIELSTLKNNLAQENSFNSSTIQNNLDIITEASQNASLIELTTTQNNLVEGNFTNSSVIQNKLDTTTEVSQNSTMQINLVEGNSANSSTIQNNLDIITEASQNASLIELTTTQNNLVERNSTNSSGIQNKLDITTEASQNSTMQINLVKGNSTNSNTIQNKLNTTTEEYHISSSIELTTEIKYTVQDTNSNTTASPQNYTVVSSVTEISISENVSSNSSTIQNKLETATIESRNSSFIELSTLKNDLAEIKNSNSSTIQNNLDIITEASQNASLIELTTTQNNLVEGNFSNSSVIQNKLDTTTEASQNSTMQINLVKGNSGNSSTIQNKLNTTTEESHISSSIELTTAQNSLMKEESYFTNASKNKFDSISESYQNYSELMTPQYNLVKDNSTNSNDVQNELYTTSEANQNYSSIELTTVSDSPLEEKNYNPNTLENKMHSTTESSQNYSHIELTTVENKLIEAKLSDSSTNQNKMDVASEASQSSSIEYTTIQNILEEESSSNISETQSIQKSVIEITTMQSNIIEENITNSNTIQDNAVVLYNSSTESIIIHKTTPVSDFSNQFHNSKHYSPTTTTESLKMSTVNNTTSTSSLREPKVPNITQEMKLCQTASCKTKTSQILKLIDQTAEPCENFYQFACKNFENEDKNSMVEILLEAFYKKQISNRGNTKFFVKFFETCVNYEDETSLMDKIGKVRNINVRKDDLTPLIKYLITRQSTPFFDIRFGPMNNQNQYTIQILPPSTGYPTVGLKDWSLRRYIQKQCYQDGLKYNYEQKINLNEVYKKYKKCEKSTFKKITTQFFTTYNTSVSDTDGFLDFFLDSTFEVSNLDIEQEMLSKNYHKLTIDELTKKYDVIDDWKGLFKNITYGGFNSSSPVYILMEDTYFRPVMKRLKDRMKTNPTSILNYMVTYFQLELGEYLLKPRTDKHRYCMEQTIELLPELANYIFVQYTKLKKSDAKIFEDTFSDIKYQFYWVVDQSQLEEDNKVLFKNKLDKLKLRHFVDLKKDQKNLDSVLDTIDLSGDHLSTVFMIIENRRQFSYSLTNPVDVFFLHYLLNDPFQLLPKYIPYSSSIVIPNIFVHEITKMKNNKIPSYVYETNIKYHLSRAVALYLDETMERTRSSFYRQFAKTLDLNLQGDEPLIFENQEITYKSADDTIWQKILNVSSSNRIADNLALKIAFANSFSEPSDNTSSLPWISESYSPEKQFFILVAQEYCKDADITELSRNLYETSELTPTLRIENLLINSFHFDEEFKCTPGTRMNPEIDKTQFDTLQPEEYEYQS